MRSKHLCTKAVSLIVSCAGQKIKTLLFFLFLLFISTTSFSQQFTAKSLGDYGNVTVMEVTGNYDAPSLSGSLEETIPRQTIAQEFFKTHKDEYDFLVIFTNFDFQMPEKEAEAFYMGAKNDTQGIGLDLFDNTQYYGSNGRLQGTIDMGNLSSKVTDPLDPKFEDTLSLLSHEMMHRWAAYVKFKDASGVISNTLLGHDSEHWSFLLDTAGSVMYGNVWQDNGNGTFTTTTSRGQMKSYSPLDLYLMGMIDKSKVPPMLLINSPTTDSTQLPQSGITVTGTAQYVTIDQIIAAMGPRIPDASTSQKNFKTAFIFATQPGTFTGQELFGIENIRSGQVTRFSVLTNGTGIVEVASTLKDDIPVNPGVTPPSSTPRATASLDAGVQWLATNQKPDGSWTDVGQTVERDTAEGTHALKNFTATQTNYLNGLQWLGGIFSGNMDFLSRKIQAFAGSGTNLTALMNELLSRQYPDGGWGSDRNYPSNPVDTALALKALAVAGYGDTGVLSRALGYLKSNQNTDGGWGTPDKGSSVQETSNVLSAFNQYRGAYQLDDVIMRGMALLVSKQNSDGGFGNSPSTVYDTATAAMTLAELNATSDVTSKALFYLLSRQSDNGSWNQSAYQTALAVETVYKATVNPDLSIKPEDISFIPASVTSLPANVVINATIWNLGMTSVPQAKVVLFDGNPSTGIKVSEQTLAFPGQASTTVTFSSVIHDGNEHLYTIVVDPDNVIKESNKLNNKAGKALNPQTTYDFEVLSSDMALSANPANMLQDVTITAKITNKGTMNAYNVQVKYFIDNAGAPYDISTQTIDVPANSTITSTITWHANKSGVAMPLTVLVDPFNIFTELSKTNNKASVPITVNEDTRPNLSASYKDIVIMPSPANQQGNATISALVKNDGFSSASNVVVNFYEGVPDSGGVIIGSQVVPIINPGGSSQVSVNWTNIKDSGEKIIYVKVDPDNQISEIRKDDNDAFTTVNILNLPDFIISTNSIVFSPAAPKEGDKVIVSVTVQNKGEQAAANVAVRFGEGGTVLDTKTIPLISGNGSAVVSTMYDTTGKKGAHTITATIDPDNVIMEQSKANNGASNTFGVQDANLWVTEQYISPNGDGVKDSTQLFFRLSAPQTVSIVVTDKDGNSVRTFTGGELINCTSGSIVWDGTDNGGMLAKDGVYQMKVLAANNAELGNLTVTVDTNRSPLLDAIGTPYLLNNNLTCGLPDAAWQWFPDESGILVNIQYTYPRVPEYPNGLYTVSSDGADLLRLVPWEWNDTTDPKYSYSFWGPTVSSDGEQIAYNFSKQSKTGTMTGAFQALNVVNRDGTHTSQIASFDASLSTNIRGFKWSTQGQNIVYAIQKANSPLELWSAHADGSGNILLDGEGVLADFDQVKWSPDGSNIAYPVLSYDDASQTYTQKIRVTDLTGQRRDVYVFNNSTDYSYVNYFDWFGNNRVIADFTSRVSVLWAIDTTGNGNHLKLSESPQSAIVVMAPNGGKLAYINNNFTFNTISASATVNMFDGERTSLVHALNAEGYCRPELKNLVWSPDSRKIIFSENISQQSEGGPCDSPMPVQLMIIDTVANTENTFESELQPFVWLSDNHTIVALYWWNSWNPNAYTPYLFDTMTGVTQAFPISGNSRFAGFSPHERYLLYTQPVDPQSACYRQGISNNVWAMSSLLNLTAELRVSRQKSAVLLKGIAADLNFDSYQLDYADVKSPGNWQPVGPPANSPVINDVFTMWVPPYEGAFFVRLTVRDKAGNTTIDQKRVFWNLTSSITNLSKSLEIFSPNGDGVQDTVELHYKVLEPVNLEFGVYDESGALVRTYAKGYAVPIDDFISWDGRDESGNIMPDGKYTIKVFDLEFFVTLDNTPPDVFVKFGLLQQEGSTGRLFVNVIGHAYDTHVKRWSLEFGEGSNPETWHAYVDGNNAIPEVDLLNNKSLLPPQDFVIATLKGFSSRDLSLWVGKKLRLVAEDIAGNKTTYISDFLEELVVLRGQDVMDAVNPVCLFNLERPEGSAQFKQVTAPFEGCVGFPNVLETIRNKIVSMNFQYATNSSKQDSAIWHDATPVVSPDQDGDITDLRWDSGLPIHDKLIRIKAIDEFGRTYYSNVVLVLAPGEPPQKQPKFAFTLFVEPEIAPDCESISGKIDLSHELSITNLAVDDLVRYVISSIDYYVQLPTGELVFYPEGNKPVVVDTRSFNEGSYPTKAIIKYTDTTNNKAIDLETSGPNLLVDRKLPTARITYPSKEAMLCPVKQGDRSAIWYGISVEGVATDENNVKQYVLFYGIGENPQIWIPAMTRLNGKSVPLAGAGNSQGRLGMWDVTSLNGTSYSLKLKVVDIAGNVSCFTTSFSISTLPEIVNLAIDKELISPNGDGSMDDVNGGFSLAEYATLDEQVFHIVQAADGATVLDGAPVRTIVAGLPHLGGAETLIWDGKNDAGDAVADGKYGVVVFATDSCGNTANKWIAVEVDNTPPTTAITYPQPSDPLGNIVEIKGTAFDLHFLSSALEAGQGDSPDTWKPISAQASPITDGILGAWNTFGLNGKWTVRLLARDSVGNIKTTTTLIDLGARKNLIKSLSATPALFSPNNDGMLDTTTIQYELTDTCDTKIEIIDTNNFVRKTISGSAIAAGLHLQPWDGADDAGAALADGSYALRLTAALASAPEVNQVEMITTIIDNTPPAIDISKPLNNSFVRNNITVAGSIADAHIAEYELTLTGPAGAIPVDQGTQTRNSYDFGILNDLLDGVYTLNVKTKDLGENSAEKNIVFTVDKTAPVVTIDASKNGGYYGGDNSVVSITGSIVEQNLNTFTLRYGLGDSPSQWTDLMSGTTIPATQPMYSWNVGLNDGVSDGVYTLSLLVTDKAGSSAEAKVKITVDNMQPNVAIDSPGDGAVISKASDIKGTAFDLNLDSYTIDFSAGQCADAYQWDAIKTSQTSVQNDLLTTWQALPLDGAYCIRATAVDKSGNKSEARVNVKVDTHPPMPPVLSGTVINKNAANLVWTADDPSSLAGYNIYRNGQKINNAVVADALYLDPNLTEGIYAYTVTAVDIYGLQSKTSNEVDLKIDLTGPNAHIGSPQDVARVSGLIDIKGTAYSANDFKQYRVYIGQGAAPAAWNLIRTSPVPISYGVLTQWDANELADNQVYSIKLEAEDIFGNITTHQISVTIDNTPPATPLLLSASAIAADATITWRTNTEADLAGYLLYRNDQLANVNGIVVGDMKPYLISGITYVDKSLPDGTFRYYLMAMDQAGNLSDQSNTLEVTIDTHPPHAVITSPATMTQFDQKLYIKAESLDLDIAQVQFRYKKVQDSSWTNLNAPVTSQNLSAYLDPASLGLSYGDYQLMAVATDQGMKTDPTPTSITVTYTDLTPPAPPQGLVSQTTGSNITLNWTANTESDLAGYNIYRIFGNTRIKINTALVTVVSQPTYQVAGLADGNYIFDVTAVDTHQNESKPSSQAPAMVYAPVIAQPYTPVAQPQIQIQGTNAAANSVVSAFDNTGSNPVSLGAATADANGVFSLTVNLTLGENRLFVRAIDSAGNVSRDANTVVVVYDALPGRVTGLTASVLGRDVSLAWNPNPEANILGYNLLRNGQKLNASDGLFASQPAFTASSVFDPYSNQPEMAMDASSSTYWMPRGAPSVDNPEWWEMDFAAPELISHVELHWGSDVDTVGNSVLYAGKDYEIQVWSGYAWITQTKVTGNAVKDNSFDFKPSYHTDRIRIVITDSTDVNSVKQIRLSEVGILKDNPIAVPGNAQPSYSDANLLNNQYEYILTAVDSYGFESLPTTTVSAVVNYVPSAPTLTAIADISDVTLTWTVSPEPSTSGYNVYKNTGQGWVNIGSTLVALTTYLDAGLLNGTYAYRVTAVDGLGNESLPSNVATVTIAVPPPGQPASLSVSPTSLGLNASWVYNGSPAAAGFNLYRSTTTGGPYTKINYSLITGNVFLDTNVTNSVTYYYEVAAVNIVGNEGVRSNEASGTFLVSATSVKPVIFFPTVPGMPLTLLSNTTDIYGSAAPGSSVALTDNGTLIGTATAQSDDAVRNTPLNYDGNGAALSPDGKMLAYTNNNTIWLKSLASGAVTRAVQALNCYTIVWSPDSRKIAYSYNYDGRGDYRINIYDVATGSSSPLTSDTDVSEDYPSWSSDGSKIVFVQQQGTSPGIWIKDIISGIATQVINSSTVWNPNLSPDGKSLTYVDNQNLYLYDLSTNVGQVVDNNTAGWSNQWSPDGKKLAFVSYRNGNGDVYMLDIATGSQSLAPGSSGYPYYLTWTADGRYVLFDIWDSTNNKDTLWMTTVPMLSQPVRIMPDLLTVYYVGSSKSGTIAFIDQNLQGAYTADLLDLKGTFSFSAASLSPGVNIFTAVAADAAGNRSDSSDAISVTFDTRLMFAPTLTATALISDVTLTWTVSPEPSTSGYNVYKNTGQGWVNIGSTPVALTTYLDAGLLNGTYAYRVTAVDGLGNESLPSNIATVIIAVTPPGQPASLGVSPTSIGLNASWVYNGSPAAAVFNLYRSTTTGGPYTKINSLLISGTSYLDTGLTSGVTYYYVVAAVDPAGNEGAYSNEASGTFLASVASVKPVIFFPTITGMPITVFSNATDIYGSAAPGSSVALTDNGTFIGTASAQSEDAVRNIPLNYDENVAALSPDGKTLAYTNNNAIWLKSLASGAVTKAVQALNCFTIIWSPDSSKIAYTYYYDGNGDWRINIYDVATGSSSPLTSDTDVREDYPSWSSDGSKIVFVQQQGASPGIWSKDIISGIDTQVINSSTVWNPKLSPDGKNLTYVDNQSLYLYDLSTNTSQVVDTIINGRSIEWSPDSKKLAFVSYRNGNGDVYILDIATASQSLVPGSSGYPYNPTWTADGRYVLFAIWDSTNNKDTLWITNAPTLSQPVRIMPDLHYVSYVRCSRSGTIAVIDQNLQGAYTADLLDLKGTFSFSAASLSPGVNIFTAVATDAAGNKSDLSAPVSITFDARLMPDLSVSSDDIYLYPPYPIAGQQMAINAVVRNTSQVDAANAEVAVYVWNALNQLELLKSETIPVLAAGSSALVTATWNSTGKIGSNRLVVVVDPSDTIAEFDGANNMAIKDFYVADHIGTFMTTALNAAQYTSNRNVNISVTLRNTGPAANAILSIQIEDANGYPVHAFDPMTVNVAYAVDAIRNLVWNTGSTYAGSYELHAILKDSSAAILAENTVPFTVLSDAADDLTVTTDKIGYNPGENVITSITIKNSGTNTIIPMLQAAVSISNAAGVVLFSEVKTATNLLPGASVDLNSVWNAGLNLPGDYHATVVVSLDGGSSVTKSAGFKINTTQLLTGTITVSPQIVPVGNVTQVSYALTNTGNADALGLTARITILDPETQAVMQASDMTLDIPANTGRNGQIAVNTTGYGLKTYTAVLQTLSQGVAKNIANTPFTVKDLIPPVVTIISPISNGTYSFAIAVSAMATDNASGLDRVEYQIDSKPWQLLPLADASQGRYAATWEIVPADNGSHAINFRATDKVGNTSVPVPVQITIQIRTDTTPPVAVIIGAPPSLTNKRSATLTVAGDNVVAYQYSLDFGMFSAETSTSTPIVLSGLLDGPHKVLVTGRDSAGNWQKQENATPASWIVDITPPALNVSTLLDGSRTNEPVLNVAGKASDANGIQSVVVSGQTVTTSTSDNINYTFSQAISLATGSNTISTTATDNATNPTTDIRTIVLDQNAPKVTITNPADNSLTNKADTDVTGYVDKMATVSIKVNGLSPLPDVVTDSTFTFPIMLAYNMNHIDVTAVDLANNPGSAIRTVTLDNLSPALAITVPNQDMGTNQSGITMSGTVSDLTNITMLVTCPTASISVVSRPTKTTWSVDVTNMQPGTNTFTVKATDELENSTSVERHIIFTSTPITIDPVKTPTKISQQLITGTMELNSTVTVSSLATMGTVTYPTTTTWQIIIAGMTEGANIISATATDLEGHISDPVTATIVLDTHAPVTTPSPAPGSYYNTVTVTLVANEPATIYDTTDGTTPAASSEYMYKGQMVLTATTTLNFFAVDMATNSEAVKSVTYTVIPDTTPPVTTIFTGNPNYTSGSGKLYVTGATNFTLSATDDISGVKTTGYRLGNGTWTTYAVPFSLFTEGSYTIGYRSTDNAANTEIEKNLVVVVDNTPPVSTISIGGSPVIASTPISIAATDTASGVRLTEYAIDGGSWATYNGVFTLSVYSQGTHTVNYRSTDNVGNVEITKSTTVALTDLCADAATRCNDNNVCTTDSCDQMTGVCSHTPVTNGTVCDDGNKCTTGDVCTSGACAGTAVVCNDNNACTGPDHCDSATGVCVYPPLTGTACDDGNKCTSGDICTSGVCAGTPVVCNDNNACTGPDHCDSATGLCIYPPLTGTACDDGNACTTNDTCVTGVCHGTPIVCNDNNACTTDACVNGTCVYTPINGGTCDDNNACTTNDTCVSGACRGTPMNCNDNNVCTDDVCVAGVCQHNANTATCDDGDPCTTGDVCANKSCHGIPMNCNDNNVCTDDICVAGVCQHSANTVAGDDGDPCTTGDVCSNKSCHGTPMNCNDNNVCTDDVCVAGVCQHNANSGACDDGDPCTTSDICANKFCHGTPMNCNDNNVCTDDVCVAGVCQHNANTAACNDGDPCTTGDVCANKVCHGTPMNCNDNNVCTDDVCVAGVCQHNANTAACDDGDPCTTGDVCSNKACHGTPMNCNDNNVCTDDVCVAGVCQHNANTATCNDGDPCTTGDVCANKACHGTPIVCNDNNACTTDACVNGACVYTPISGGTCNDGNACTTNDTCVSGVCKGTPIVCIPQNLGVFGATGITMSGGYIDSYDSTKGSYSGTHGSNVSIGTNSKTNGAITLSGGVIDYGNAYVGPGGDPTKVIIMSGGAVINGTKGALSTLKNMTPKSDPGGGTQTTFTNGTTLTSGTYRVSSINLSGSGKGAINGNVTLYVTGSVNLSGSSQIVILPGGSLTIYISGSLNVSGGSIVNQTQSPRNLTIYGTSTCTSANYSGSSALYGVIYTPAAMTSISGTVSVYGSVIGGSVTISGGAAVHYDASLGNIGN